MAQISIVRLKDIKEAKRFDAEYFKPEYLKNEKIIMIHNWDFLSNLYILNSRYKQPVYDENSDIKIINSQYLREDKIDYEIARSGINKLVPYEAVMINSTGIGTLGRVNINYLKNIKISVDSHINIIVTNEKVNPYYLTIFLQSKYGKNQIERNISGSSGQIEIYPRDFDKFKIPLLPQSFQLQIEKIVKEAYEKQSLSKKLYKEAEQILLEELDLLDFKPKHKLTFTTTKKEIEQAKRFDAEYFQPEYEEIIEKIKSYKGGWDFVGNIVNIKDKNFIPKKDKKYKYIALADISNQGYISSFSEDFGENLPTRARRKVNTGDVIVSSIEGSLNSCALVDEEFDNSICSTGFYVMNSEKINSETLLILIKSFVIQKLLKRGCKGTILTAIPKDELEKIIIPLISPQIQIQISQKIQESFKLRKEAKELLEKAKKMVEDEIKKVSKK